MAASANHAISTYNYIHANTNTQLKVRIKGNNNNITGNHHHHPSMLSSDNNNLIVSSPQKKNSYYYNNPPTNNSFDQNADDISLVDEELHFDEAELIAQASNIELSQLNNKVNHINSSNEILGESHDLDRLLDAAHSQDNNNSFKVRSENNHIASTFVLLSAILGAGILSLPYAVAKTGFILGPFLLIIGALVTRYTIKLLVSAAKLSNTNSYEELAFYCYGRIGCIVLSLISCILIFGSLVAFLVIIGDTATVGLNNLFNLNHALSHATVLIFVTIFLLFPLCLLRSVHQLERFAALAVSIIICFSIVIIVDGIISVANRTDNRLNISAFIPGISIFESIPIVLLAYTCQTMIYPIYNNLTPKTITNMNRVVDNTIYISSVLYITVGLFAYIQFSYIHGDVLNNFSATSTFYNIIRLFFSVAIIIHYPIIAFAFKNSLLTLLKQFNIAINNLQLYNILQTIFLITITNVLAIILPNLSIVFSLTGSLTGFPFCFILPLLFYLKVHEKLNNGTTADDTNSNIKPTTASTIEPGFSSNKQRTSLKTSERILIYSILIFSVLACVISILVNFNELVHSF
jgi:amino acid permease